LPVACL